MALQLSRAKLEAMAKRAQGLEARAKKIKEKSEEAIETAVRTVEVTGAAFLAGAMYGYTYDPSKRPEDQGISIMGVPLDLGLGVAGHLLGFAVLSNDTAKHAHAFADGFLAASAVGFGQQAGLKLKKKLAEGGVKTSGMLDE